MTNEEILATVAPWDCLAFRDVELPALFSELEGCKSLLEIGTFRGATTAALALKFPEMQITTIDLPDVSKSTNKHAKRDEEIGIAIRYLQLDRIEQVRMDSRHLGTFVDEGRHFDAVFVDGDHTAAAVFRDLTFAEALTKPDGVIICHDYTEPSDYSTHPQGRPPWTIEVYEAVQMFLQFSKLKAKRLPGWLVALKREF